MTIAEDKQARRAGGPGARRVVITGLGAITPVGHTAPDTWAAFVAGRSGVDHVTSFDVSQYPARIAAEVKGFDPTAYIPAKEARRMARCSQLAVVAAREAVADAGIDWAQEDRERAGVILGTGMGGTDILIEPIGRYGRDGMVRVTPYVALEHLANMPAFHVGIEHGCLGTLSTIVTACAAGTQAIGEGLELIRRGKTDIVLAGGTESQVNMLFFTGFSAMRVLSTRNDDPQAASRPLDVDRDGFVIGEGAVMLVIETLASAKARGAKIYGTLAGYGISADSHDIVQPEPTGSGQFSAMVKAMRNAGLEPADVKHVNAHGTSTPQGDVTEARSIARALGSAADDAFVTSTKSMTGHLLGGAGALETFATVMALRDRISPPTINLENPEPDLGIQIAANTARELSSGPLAALNNSFGFGGHNVALALTNDNMTD